MVVGGNSTDGLPALPTFQCLEGEIDGNMISTAGIVAVHDDIIETNCGRYKLGKINQEYAEELGWEPDLETVLEAIKEGI